MENEKLRKLYVIEASVDYGELPKNFRQGWCPSFGLHFEDICISDDQKCNVYISLNGKLKKSKCDFIEDENLAQTFLNHIEPKLKKIYPSIRFNTRNVKSMELDYRRKKALDEAKLNSFKIMELLNKFHTNF